MDKFYDLYKEANDIYKIEYNYVSKSLSSRGRKAIEIIHTIMEDILRKEKAVGFTEGDKFMDKCETLSLVEKLLN